jgi:hypothetical protein
MWKRELARACTRVTANRWRVVTGEPQAREGGNPATPPVTTLTQRPRRTWLRVVCVAAGWSDNHALYKRRERAIVSPDCEYCPDLSVTKGAG